MSIATMGAMAVSGGLQVCGRCARHQELEIRYFDTSPLPDKPNLPFLRSKLGNAKQGCATSQHTSGGSRTQPVKPDAIHRLPIATPRKCQSASAILPSSLPLRSPHARWEDAAASTRGSRPESPILFRNGPGAFRPTRRPDPAPPGMTSSCGSGRGSASSPQRRGSRPRIRHHQGWTPSTERTAVLKSDCFVALLLAISRTLSP